MKFHLKCAYLISSSSSICPFHFRKVNLLCFTECQAEMSWLGNAAGGPTRQDMGSASPRGQADTGIIHKRYHWSGRRMHQIRQACFAERDLTKVPNKNWVVFHFALFPSLHKLWDFVCRPRRALPYIKKARENSEGKNDHLRQPQWWHYHYFRAILVSCNYRLHNRCWD